MKPDEFAQKVVAAYEEGRGVFANKVNAEDHLLENLSPRYINEAVTRYKKNTGKLLDEYDGNPRRIFEKAKTAKEAVKLIREFRGFGPKIGNFFVRTMVNTFGYEYTDIENILPPVDRHDVNIAYLLGYVDSNEMTKKNIREVKELWSDACREAGVSWLTFDKALWLFGSEGRPQNQYDISDLLI